jgi:hypothetical protein
MADHLSFFLTRGYLLFAKKKKETQHPVVFSWNLFDIAFLKSSIAEIA